jgi:hypothetical protein
MRMPRVVGAVVSPIVLAMAAILVLKRYGLASARVVSIATVAALAVSIGNGLLVVIQLMKK